MSIYAMAAPALTSSGVEPRREFPFPEAPESLSLVEAQRQLILKVLALDLSLCSINHSLVGVISSPDHPCVENTIRALREISSLLALIVEDDSSFFPPELYAQLQKSYACMQSAIHAEKALAQQEVERGQMSTHREYTAFGFSRMNRDLQFGVFGIQHAIEWIHTYQTELLDSLKFKFSELLDSNVPLAHVRGLFFRRVVQTLRLI